MGFGFDFAAMAWPTNPTITRGCQYNNCCFLDVSFFLLVGLHPPPETPDGARLLSGVSLVYKLWVVSPKD